MAPLTYPLASARTLGVVLLLACGGCASAPRSGHESLQSTIWTQHAAEYDATSRQLFAVAADRLEQALADPTWSALDQQDSVEELPPAIVLDIDETVLDNSPYQARMILDDNTYDAESWDRWVRLASARALPGAREFLALAQARDVAIFYVSNRKAEHEEATRLNLVAVGLPVEDDGDRVLVVGESGWTGDKEDRRQLIAARFRVLLLLGDDLNDFVSARDVDPAQRRLLVEANAAKWGRQWIVMPNQSYGSWEGSLLPHSGSREEALEQKRGLLRPFG